LRRSPREERQGSRARRLEREAPPGPAGRADHQEAGIKDFETVAWFGIVAPAGTPRPVLARLNAGGGMT
jgi:hypothetical protein